FTKILEDFGISDKILSITANNTLNNDTMTTALAENVTHFGGDTARTWCFLHIVNLVAKSLLKQFDVPKNEALAFVGTAEEELQEIGQGLEAEDEDTITENGASDPNADDSDNLDGWVDEVGELSDEERNILQNNICPIKFVLAKV
ncbi:hypothetical protein CY34DRAFT_33142, partial [Suillus luteus UH-Slu-Lm8-n1]